MATRNPACGNGTAVVVAPGQVVAECPCGWTDGYYPSKSKALAAQKTHRFGPFADTSGPARERVTA